MEKIVVSDGSSQSSSYRPRLTLMLRSVGPKVSSFLLPTGPVLETRLMGLVPFQRSVNEVSWHDIRSPATVEPEVYATSSLDRPVVVETLSRTMLHWMML